MFQFKRYTDSSCDLSSDRRRELSNLQANLKEAVDDVVKSSEVRSSYDCAKAGVGARIDSLLEVVESCQSLPWALHYCARMLKSAELFLNSDELRAATYLFSSRLSFKEAFSFYVASRRASDQEALVYFYNNVAGISEIVEEEDLDFSGLKAQQAFVEALIADIGIERRVYPSSDESTAQKIFFEKVTEQADTLSQLDRELALFHIKRVASLNPSRHGGKLIESEEGPDYSSCPEIKSILARAKLLSVHSFAPEQRVSAYQLAESTMSHIEQVASVIDSSSQPRVLSWDLRVSLLAGRTFQLESYLDGFDSEKLEELKRSRSIVRLSLEVRDLERELDNIGKGAAIFALSESGAIFSELNTRVPAIRARVEEIEEVSLEEHADLLRKLKLTSPGLRSIPPATYSLGSNSSSQVQENNIAIAASHLKEFLGKLGQIKRDAYSEFTSSLAELLRAIDSDRELEFVKMLVRKNIRDFFDRKVKF